MFAQTRSAMTLHDHGPAPLGMARGRLAKTVLATVATLAASTFLVAPSAAAAPQMATAAPAKHGDTSQFRGVNWADPRDNYASDEVVPSGLSLDDDYRTTYKKSAAIVSEFRRELRANTIRLPINPSSVDSAWWDSYQAAIDASTRRGFKVILGYWEADDAKNGRVDDPAAWSAMWDTVTAEYGRNPKVYFEPMNEPFGYDLGEWVSLTSTWLKDHRDVPRKRVVISGTGYNDDVTGVGAAPELKGTLLSLHFYGYWADHTTEEEWLANLQRRIGDYGWRTIIDEAGAPMTTGLNYGNHEGNVSTSYLAALTQTAREQSMGVVYWPGLRTGDAYSLTTLVGDGDLEVTNESGLAQLQWGWGLLRREQLNDLPPAPPGEIVRGVGSDRCLDVPGFSTTTGTALDLWECNAGGNQSWNLTADQQLTIYGSMCLTIGGDGSSAGSPGIIADCTGAANQTWELSDDGAIHSLGFPDLCLSAAGGGTGNGTAIDVWYCNGQTNQQWTRS